MYTLSVMYYCVHSRRFTLTLNIYSIPYCQLHVVYMLCDVCVNVRIQLLRVYCPWYRERISKQWKCCDGDHVRDLIFSTARSLRDCCVGYSIRTDSWGFLHPNMSKSTNTNYFRVRNMVVKIQLKKHPSRFTTTATFCFPKKAPWLFWLTSKSNTNTDGECVMLHGQHELYMGGLVMQAMWNWNYASIA